MKITQVICQVLRINHVEAKTASSQDSVLVRIRTDDGLEGIGEADSSPEMVKAAIDAPFSHNVASGLRELLIGEHPLETDRIWEKMYRRTMYCGRRSTTISAMAAVDMALWDLKGKYFGEPIHRLLGGKKHDRILAYASILFGNDGEETARIGERWREHGYRAVKFGWEPMGQCASLDEDLVRGARRDWARTRCCSLTPGASGTRGPRWTAPGHSRSSGSDGWKNRCTPMTTRDTAGCATVLPFRLPPGKRNAAARRFVRSSTADASMSIRSTSRATASPMHTICGSGSRKSEPGCAITVTPVP
jgi:hypothetical protein